MEAEARYTLVGAGAILLVVALVAAVLWLEKFSEQDQSTPYTIYFYDQRVDGLQVDSAVNMRGVDIGRVVSYELADYREGELLINRVRVNISVDKQVPVFTSTVAVITRNLVTGIAQVSLVTPDTEGAQLLEAINNEPYPVIAEGRSDLEELAGKVERLSEMAGEIMGNLNRLLTSENRDSFTQLISNLAILTDNLNQRMDNLDTTLDGVNTATQSITRAGDQIAGLAVDAGNRMDNVATDLQRTLSQAEQAMQDISQAMQSLEQQGQTLTAQFDRTGAVLSDQAAAAVAELRLSLESAEQTLQRLQEPRTAIFGVNPTRLGPGEEN